MKVSASKDAVNRYRFFYLSASLLVVLLTGWFICSSCIPARAEIPASDRVESEKGAVCELDQRQFTVRNPNHGVMKVHRIFRIYNQAGKRYGRVVTRLNRFIRVDDLKAELRDSDGRLIKKLRKEDIQEASLVPGYVLYSDDRTKYFDLSTTTFPYTLEYSYKVKYKSLLYWPGWSPQMEIPVERSVYVLTAPKDFVFQIHQHNLKIDPVERMSKGKRELIFELNQVPPFEPEKMMPPEADHRMAVLLAPGQFDLDGYVGSTDSWEGLGEWYASLASEQYSLSSTNRELVHDLVAHCSSAQDTIKGIYQFIQRKTRYVAIKLGIGGVKPREAESVLLTGYGDCKDLSTLFIAMLESVGIRAHPVLIRTRDEGTVLVDFPSSQFNHVIACVPLRADTLWLDCTSNYSPFGELPWQDEGCYGLVVMEDSAALIRTPVTSAEENRLQRAIQATLSQDGSVQIRCTLTATGDFESYYRGLFNSLDAAEKKEWLDMLVGSYAPNHTVTASDFESVSDLDQPFSIAFSAKLVSYATRSGDELLLNLNMLSRVDAEDIPNEKERKYPVDNRFVFTVEDQVTFHYPESLRAKVLPVGQTLVCPYAKFQTEYAFENHKITYKRSRIVTETLVPPTDFMEYKAFLEQAYRSDHSFVVFTSAE